MQGFKRRLEYQNFDLGFITSDIGLGLKLLALTSTSRHFGPCLKYSSLALALSI